jgi:hypothetical protein
LYAAAIKQDSNNARIIRALLKDEKLKKIYRYRSNTVDEKYFYLVREARETDPNLPEVIDGFLCAHSEDRYNITSHLTVWKINGKNIAKSEAEAS